MFLEVRGGYIHASPCLIFGIFPGFRFWRVFYIYFSTFCRFHLWFYTSLVVTIQYQVCFFVFFFHHAFYYLRTFSFFFSVSKRNSDPGALSRLFFPPHYTYALSFLSREGCSYFFPCRFASNGDVSFVQNRRIQYVYN